MTTAQAPVRSGPPAIAGRFRTMGKARDVVRALDNAGIDGNDLRLVGPAAEAAATATTNETADRRVTRYVTPRVVAGTAIGAVVGAAVGLVASLLALAAKDDVSSGAALVTMATLGVALLGAVVGAMLTFERTVSLSEDWPMTFEETGTADVWVAVYTEDAVTRARAADTLERFDPVEIRGGGGATAR